MREGWRRQRSYELEGPRLVAYVFAAANREKGKHFPQIQEWLPLLTDEKPDKDYLERQRIELVEKINRLYGKNLTA